MKAYFLRVGEYLRYDLTADRADPGYPKATTKGWSGLDGTAFTHDVDAALDLGTGKVYLFKGADYVRIDQQTNALDGGPTPIAEAWGGFADAGFGADIDAAVNWGNGKAYLFKGDVYVRYDIASDRIDDGYPLPIAGNWPGVGFARIDAAINAHNGKAYLFQGAEYVRYDMASDRVDDGYPTAIAGNWPGVGFGAIDAAWVKLASGTPTPNGNGRLEPGDHVWYFAGQVSRERDVPRAAWFPDSTGKTDYQGHGDEIFNFVVHAGGVIFRGRPHMRGREGTFAWLNHNPGNIMKSSRNLGQYPGKVNWHDFMIFPTREAGYDAIRLLLRNPPYRDLSIIDAFRRYAPASDGNDPETYGQSVAAAAGVSPHTRVGDLDDAQMRVMQDKIAEIEGAREGVTLTADHPDLPDAIRTLLG